MFASSTLNQTLEGGRYSKMFVNSVLNQISRDEGNSQMRKNYLVGRISRHFPIRPYYHYIVYLIKCQSCHYIENNQLICRANII